MATHQADTIALQRLECTAQQDACNTDGFNLPTQLSTVDSCDSPLATSTQLTFTYQNDKNLNGNLLFPLAGKYEKFVEHKQMNSWHGLLNYLRSQQIVINNEVFKKLKIGRKHALNAQCPLLLAERHIGKDRFRYKNITFKLRKLNISLKLAGGKRMFLYNRQGLKEANENQLSNKDSKIGHLSSQLKRLSKMKHMLRELPMATYCERYSCPKILNGQASKKFPLRNNNQVALKIFPNRGNYTFGDRPQSKLSSNIKNSEKQSNTKHTLLTATYDQNVQSKFPCEDQLATLGCHSKFPIQYKYYACDGVNYEYSFNNIDINSVQIYNSKNPKSYMEQCDQKQKAIDHEHVLQVQDSQHCVKNSSHPLTLAENKQTPPQPATVISINGKHGGDDDVGRVNMLAHINSINNTRPNELRYYAEKIERLQDAIVALFEKIQISLTTTTPTTTIKTNHNSEYASTNVAKYDNGDDTARFALTPPMSVTSVRNTERNNNKDFLFEKYDLLDLCDRQVGQIVECSDVRDILAETVDDGATKEQTKSTGSLLVKSEEPVPSNSPIPNPLNESESTSLKDHKIVSELLPEYKVHIRNNQAWDPNKLKDFSQLTPETAIPASNLISADVNEMTVTQESTSENNSLRSDKVLDYKNNNLFKDLKIDEMKFEMSRVKGGLPTSASERSLGKHDAIKKENENAHYGRHSAVNSTRLSIDPTVSKNRLSQSLSSTRNYGDSSPHTPRVSSKPESSTLNDTFLSQSRLANRPVLNTAPLIETINSTSDTLSHRRPSLGSLRNTQSASLLSVDLPRYTPLTILNQTDQTSSVNRAASIDSSLGDVLPERTRLRRQRRLRTQGSQDEPEDAIERLNRLKARISASLSEVKGVLKQYSTEAENDNESQKYQTLANAPADRVRETQEDEKKEGPVVFRFVKKVRRRSIFTEDEEKELKTTETNVESSKENTANHFEKQLEPQDQTDNCKLEVEIEKLAQNSGTVNVPAVNASEKRVEDEKNKDASHLLPFEPSEIKLKTDLYTLKEEVPESLEQTTQTETQPQNEIVEHIEHCKTSKGQLQSLKEANKGAIPKKTIKHETTKLEKESPLPHDTAKKIKRKIIIKSKDPSRRASLAAVEGSKIEPPVKETITAKVQRRPSDSEAVIKNKLITAKLNTSGAVEEVTPKVKKPSIKTNNNTQLATAQMKLEENGAAHDKSDNQIEPIDKDSKSICADKDKDVLMPKRSEPEQQKQINIEITSQTNLLLPTQLVIDHAASLTKKTIENSVLSARQRQQQQHEEPDQQATNKSTATNLKSNDLQIEGAMLDNVTTVLSSPAASEANSQIKREKVVEQEYLDDRLQQENAITKPTTNQQTELKLGKQVEQCESNKEELPFKQEPVKNINEKEESAHTTSKTIEQQSTPKQHQHEAATTDVAHAKIVVGVSNKNEDIKAKESLKETCIAKAISTSVGAEHQQTQTQQQQYHHHPNQLRVEDEQPITSVADTKAISSPHISISSTSDFAHKTATASSLPTESDIEQKAETSANQKSTMPELQLAPAPVQTADINSHPENHKKKIVIKKIARQSSTDKGNKSALEITKATQDAKQTSTKPALNHSEHSNEFESSPNQSKSTQESEQITDETSSDFAPDESNEECSESTEISESTASIPSKEVSAEQTTKKERKVKKKVIIKRQKRRLSIGDSFFHSGNETGSQNAEIETLEKPIAFVSDDEDDQSEENDKEARKDNEQEAVKKPLKSCILQKEYNIGDEVLYAERFKKTQIKWRRGRIKERITSISYLLDIDGKDVSSHINYLKKFTGRKVSFGGKEYLEIDYEQLAEEEEKAERLQRRTYSIWNMV